MLGKYCRERRAHCSGLAMLGSLRHSIDATPPASAGTRGLIAAVAGALLVGLAASAAPNTAGADAADTSVSLQSAARMDEVIVTAQRRSERLQDVPLSVVVHSAEELERSGIQSLRELSQVTPGVQIPNNGAYVAPAIRGISSDVASPGAQNSVAVYVDGVYQPAQGTAAFDLPDVNNVQILKGPQGTLYGRNSSAGAILISTADPTITPTGRAFVSYGKYGDFESKLLLSGPIVGETVAGSIAGYYHSNDGYVRDLLRGGRTGALDAKLVRGKLMITPNEQFSVKLTGYYSSRNDRAVFADSVPYGNSIAITVPGAVVATEPFTTAQDPESAVLIDTRGASAELLLETAIGTFSSVTGWTKMDAKYLANAEFSSAGLVYYIVENFEHAYTEDLTFTSRKFGDVSLIAGVSYLDDDGKFDPLTILGITELYDRTTTRALSGFGEVTYDVTDRLSLVGGARYSTEKKKQYVSFGVRAFPEVDNERWSAVTPRASIKYKISDDFSTYLTYSEGFKSGSYSSFSFTPVDQEDVKAFEFGLKGNVAGALAFNAAVFRYRFSNMQVQSVQAGQVTVQNAGSSKVYGLDLDGTYAATDRLTLRGALSLLHARFKSFPDAAVTVPNPVCPTGFRYCGNIVQTLDISGTPLARAPDWTASLSANYDIPLNSGSLSFMATGSYNSGFLWTAGDIFEQGAYAVVNGQVTWTAPNDRLKVSLWGRNLTDRTYGMAHGIGDPATGIAWASPRTGGVSVEYSL